ncbi:hypothetical protein EI555_014990, partial [Monodon monoceros]
RPDDDDGGGGGGDCGGDGGENSRCPWGAAAGSAAARTVAEGPAGRGAEQLRHAGVGPGGPGLRTEGCRAWRSGQMEAIAKYDFKATADDELSFKRGDILK